MYKAKSITILRVLAISGNILFILWVLFNAMDEGFKGTLIEKLSAAGLISLLAINCFLLFRIQLSNQQESN